MTIAVTCPCGGRFAAQPHLAGKTVRCPQCQRSLQVPLPPREPLAPIVNPFSDDAPIPAELVPPIASAPPPHPSSHDPFGGKATVGGPAVGRPYAESTPTYAAPKPYGQPETAQYAQSFDPSERKSYTGYYIIGAVLFGFVGFVFVAGLGMYQFIKQLEGMSFDGSQPLAVQHEDYAAARARFKTNLTSRGAAPQEWEPLDTPDGAVDLMYESDGHTLRAFVDPPPADGQTRPGVVFLHGGFAWGNVDWEMSQPYRAVGYVVMSPVLRGENGQPGHFSLYYDEVDDVLAATSAFAALPYVDETELYIAGHSAGGTLATLTAMTSDRFLGMASYSGTMNQEAAGDWNPGLVVYNTSNEREMLMRSPEAFAASFKCPARLYYGGAEQWFAGQTNRTVATARRAGLDVEATVVPGDHMSSVRPAMHKSISFFRQIGIANGKRPTFPSVWFSAPEESAPNTPEPDAVGVGTANDFPHVNVPQQGVRPTIPEPPRVPGGPNSPYPPTPPLIRARPNALHQGLVTIEVIEYTGRMPQRMAAQRALARSHWADFPRLEIDQEAGIIKVPVRKGPKVDVESAQEALKQVGFKIGAATFKPLSAENPSKAEEKPGE